MHYSGIFLMKMYNFFVLIPRWLLYIISGSLASFIIQLLHKPSKATNKQDGSKKEGTPAPAVKAAPTATASGSTPTKGGKAKQRNSKK